MINWFYSIFEVRIGINEKEAIFGIINPYDDKIINYINFCMLNMKHYIYKQKMAEKQLNWLDCIAFIKKEMVIKEESAKINNQGKKFQNEWEDFASKI